MTQKIIRSAERYHAKMGWLETRWHFSFDHYYDPKNTNWGALRVFNDDIVAPASGFGTHPHRNMEIVTYVISGELEHRDSVGNRGLIRPGEVQVMSAGKGIQHSEMNPSPDTPLRLLQLWIQTRTKGTEPRWEQRKFTPADRAGKLLPVVSSGETADTLHIDQDASIFLSSLAPEQQVEHALGSGRRGYLFVIEGKVTVNGELLQAGDQSRLEGAGRLAVSAAEASELIFLDLPEAA